MLDGIKFFLKPLDDLPIVFYNGACVRGVAQFGSALPWGGRGREFESRRSDHFLETERRKACFVAFFHAKNAIIPRDIIWKNQVWEEQTA